MIQRMRKKHPQYFAIPLYIKIAKKSDMEIAQDLHMSINKFYSKINGEDDFTPQEAIRLSKLLARRQEEIFLT